MSVKRFGWVGERPLIQSEMSDHFVLYHPNNTEGTAELIRRYADLGARPQYVDPLHQAVGSGKLFSNHAAGMKRDINDSAEHDKSCFSIVTSFYRHYEYFKKCAQSVCTLFNQSNEEDPVKFEWIITNDDPSFSYEDIVAAIPEDIASFVRIIHDGKNEGISHRTNQLCMSAAYDNIIFLDCDDLIENTTFSVLGHYLNKFPTVRYISSTCLDIDEDCNIVRQRFHAHPSTEMFERGMLAGHLKCIKRSLYNELGGFDLAFSGVQDYDFALRTLLQEQILLIPEALYRYRWHPHTQSLSREIRQANSAECARKNALNLLVSWANEPSLSQWTRDDKGVCIIRTIGKDIKLLLEAVDSVLENGLVACVVSHTSIKDFELIQERIRKDNVIVLHAPDLNKKRGYPINVALDYIADQEGEFGYFCLLDDDDYLLPNFAQDLLAVAISTRSDVVYGLANSVDSAGKRACQHAPCPSIALIGGNFIPVGSYIVNLRAFEKHHIRFSEDIHYLEDWEFLIKLLQSGMKFSPYFKAVSEYRLIGDGNTDARSRPSEFEFCSHIVRATASRASLSFDIIDFWREICAFPDKEVYRISPGGMGAISEAKRMLIHKAEFAL